MAQAPALKRFDFVFETHLQHAWRRAGQERLDPQLAVEREQQIFALIAQCDPTPEQRCLDWLAAWRRRQWEIGGLRAPCGLHDLEALSVALERFEAVRRQLPSVHRDINGYRTAQELMESEFLVHSHSGQRLRDAARALADEGSEMLFQHERWRLVRLKSQAAAQYWGRGTRWCTAAERNNAFASYAQRGALLMLQTPQGRYQLSIGSWEFCDEADRPANLKRVLARAPAELRRIVLDRGLG